MEQSPEAIDPGELRATGERIDTLLDALGSAGPLARERAEELLRLVTDLYGSGLQRFMELLHERGSLDADLLAELAADDLVASLLLVHGLHPYDVATRVEQALESVRPYLGSHGGDVELLEVDDLGAVRLRLLGSCDGCPSSSVTLKLAVETAIEGAAPEVTAIEVEEASSPDAAGPLIPIDSLRSRLSASTAPEESGGGGWVPVERFTELASGELRSATVAGASLLLCRMEAEYFAFGDRCARCESSLGGATLARRLGGQRGEALLRCPRCGVHYDVKRAGACVDVSELHLDPLPVLADAGVISVALPAGVGA